MESAPMRPRRKEQSAIGGTGAEARCLTTITHPSISPGHAGRQHVLAGRGPIDMKNRQAEKIREIGQALVESGLLTLDQQARVLGLSRSTVWTILKANHKSSGLSAGIIVRMLARQHLPDQVRSRILEYIEEKQTGVYGDSALRCRKFTARLASTREWRRRA